MKLIAAFICTLLFLFSISKTPAQQKNAKTLLWRITGKGMQQPSYLFGTMHLKDRRLFFFGDSVYKNITAATGFAMELDPEAMLDSLYIKLSKEDTSSLLLKTLNKKKYAAVAKKLEHQYKIFIKSIANFSCRYNALQVLLLNGAL